MSPYQFEIFTWLVSLFLGLITLILSGGLWYFRQINQLTMKHEVEIKLMAERQSVTRTDLEDIKCSVKHIEKTLRVVN